MIIGSPASAATIAAAPTRQRVVVVEIDDHPLSLRTPTPADYLSRFLAAASNRPAAELVGIDSGGLRQRYRIRRSARFSDGSRVEARHVLAAIRAALAVPALQRFLTALGGVHADGDQLELALHEPAGYLPALLSTVDFSPMPPDPALSSGHYAVPQRIDDAYLLRPVGDGAPLLVAVNSDIDRTAARFDSGDVDLTCNTAFPMAQLPQLRRHPAYRTAPTGIVAQLEPVPGTAGAELSAAARRALSAAVDRTAIRRALHGGVAPAKLWPIRPAIGPGPLPTTLTIGYHDYFPNRQIGELVARAWRRELGITAELVRTDYVSGDAGGVDLLLVLRYPTFPHVFARWEPYNLVLGDRTAAGLLAQLGRNLVAPHAIERALAQRYAELSPVIPLVEILGHWLERREVTGFRWPAHGKFPTNLVRWRC